MFENPFKSPILEQLKIRHFFFIFNLYEADVVFTLNSGMSSVSKKFNPLSFVMAFSKPNYGWQMRKVAASKGCCFRNYN